MASSASRAKRDREKARDERRALKQEKRAAREAAGDEGEEGSSLPAMPQDEVLARLAALHDKFGNGDIELDDFEAAKAELIRALDV